ncbi:MAG: ABC transporter permease [Anaerolineales bacterium]|nr:ABC transporter permease [Anaerolineales bacterium]
MRPRWRKVFSDLWDNKLRTLLVIVSIAVGVFSVGMIAGSYAIISHDMSASYAGANPANIEIWTDPFDDDLLGTLENVPGVHQVEGRRIVSVRVRVGEDEWVSLDLVAVSDFEASQINLLLPVDGAAVPGDKQVLLERGGLKDIPAQVGQVLEFQMADGLLRSMPVAGIVLDQSTGAGDFLASPMGYISFDTLEWLGQSKNYNRLYLTVLEEPNDENYIRQVADAVGDKLERGGRQAYRQQFSKTNEHPMASTVQAILGVLGALGVLIVLLSSSLIANTLNALLNQHLRHIGVMKLVGARNFQIFGMYMTLITIFGVVALLISIPLGGQAAYALSELIADQMNFNLLGYRVVPLAFLIQTVIALLVPLAAGFVPVNNGSRITVQRAISGGSAAEGSGKAGQETTPANLGSMRRGLSRRIPRPLLLSIRNTFRRKGRLALTLFTLTMGGAIFIAVFNVSETLDQYIGRIGDYFLADVTLNFDRPYRLSEIERVAMQVPNVVSVEGWAFISGEVLYPDGRVAENINILAPPPDSPLVDPILLAGRWILPGDENALAVSEALLATFPDLQPGDLLRLKINGREQDWTVVGIFKFVDRDNILGYASYKYVSEMLNLANQAFSYRIVTTGHTRTDQEMMSVRIDRFFRDRGYHVNDVEAGLATMKTASEGLDVLVTFLLIMALLTATVGSMGLTGTMGMNVLERTREIGVMRSIGAVDWEIIKSVIVEGMLIGLISWVLGALLSFPISVLLTTIISLAIFNTPIEQTFTFQGFAIWLMLVLSLSALASALPAHNAARLTIREVLAYE